MNYKRQNTSPKVRFIYSDSPSYRLSPSRPLPLDQSITQQVVPFQSRPVSLQTRKQDTQNTFQEQQNHISIVEDSFFASKRTRRHKIFEESSSIGRQSLSRQGRRKNQRIFGENANSFYKSPPKPAQPVMDNLYKIQQVEIKNIQFTNQRQFTMSKPPIAQEQTKKETIPQEREIKKEVQQSAAQTVSPLPQTSIQIRQKEQQINYLKLQVERLKRCQKISKQNECLYKRLSQKIKSQTFQISRMENSRKQSSKRYSDKKGHYEHKYTPINSLNDIKTNLSLTKLTTNFVEDKTVKIEVKTEPIKNGQKQIKKQQEIIGDSGISMALTFNQTRRERGRSHSKRVNIENGMNLTQIHQRLLNSTKNRKQISEITMSHRLQEINSQLQRKMASIGRAKSRSRPQKQNLIDSFPTGGVTVGSFYPSNIKHLMYMY